MTAPTDTDRTPHLPPRVLARKAEAAAWLGLSERGLHDLIAAGLPTIRPTPNVVLVDLRAALRWLRARGAQT